MDFLPDKEFHIIFDRISRKVNLQGAYTPDEIDRRLKHRIKADEFAIESGYLEDEKTKRRFKRDKKNLKKLVRQGFAERTIAYARRHPDDKVALTLHHGYAKAKEILLARSRRFKYMLRKRRR